MKRLNLQITIGCDIVTDNGSRFTWTNCLTIPPAEGPGLWERLRLAWQVVRLWPVGVVGVG